MNKITEPRKIFNDQGFLTKEGQTFVDDGFTKELKKVFGTTKNPNDILIITALLKGIVDNQGSLLAQELLPREEIKSPKAAPFRIIQGGKED